MAARTRYRINLLPSEREFLEKLVRAHGTPQQLARRARIVLLVPSRSSFINNMRYLR